MLKKIIEEQIVKCGSRYALAKAIGVTASTIQKWESGATPQTSILKLLLFISEDEKELEKNIKKLIKSIDIVR